MNGCCGISYELMQKMVIPVRRECRITWDNGLTFANDVKNFDIKGIIIPLTGKELLLVPEGDRFRQQVWVYTQQEIRDNDSIIWDGYPYEVQIVENWGSYRRSRAMKMDVGPEGDQ